MSERETPETPAAAPPVDGSNGERRSLPRLVVIGVLALLVGAAAVADRVDRPEARVVARAPADMPTAAPASSLSSTWYCPGGTAKSDGSANGTVVIANPSRTQVTAIVTVVPDTGQPASTSIQVGPRSRQAVRYVDVVQAAYAAALVEIDGGEAVVEHAVTGPLGEDAAPCASAPSANWYFADGSTAKDATLLLSLFNPFPEDAIADLSFATDQGRAVPAALQGVVVPARSVVVKSVGDFVRRRELVGTTVSVRDGRLAVAKTQLHNGGGRKGMALVLGAPSPGEEWEFPEGYTADGITERFVIYNPTEQEAAVDLALTLDEGAAEPFELTVPPRGQVMVEANKESRIPKGVAHAATVRSANGVPVVAEQTIDAATPARAGFANLLGSRATARRWVLAAGSATETLDEWVTVRNPGTRKATLSLTALAQGQPLAIEGLQDVEIPAGRRAAFRIGDHLKRPDLAILVTADVPVVVQRSIYKVNGSGMTATMGVPLR